jgi:hypothetical protein
VSLADVDATLARFVAAVDTMTVNLVDLESNPTNKLLDPAGLVGVSKQRIAAARQTLDGVWGYFTAFKALVEQARALRGSGGRLAPARVAELEALLHGRSINLPPIDVPLEQRSLLTPGQTSVTASPGELLTYMDAAFGVAKSEVLAVEGVWRALLPRLGDAEHAVAELQRLASSLGEAADPDLARMAVTTSDLGRTITSDPLAVSGGQFDGIETTLGVVRARLGELARRRDALGHDLERAAALLSELATTLGAGQSALDEARVKVASPDGLLAPLSRSCLTEEHRGLEPWLERLRRLAAEGNWKRASRGLEEWSSLAAQTLAAARTVAAANTAPLHLRDELRGRLDAFTAKAERLGLTEDPDLSALRSRARAVLYSAPADLGLAAELVTGYGAALRTGRGPR